ncbi:hypothetical protein DXG01_005331 [Tephrocybe rancida]|nr:hypothetical protein DXG01_005331 [Tephrocybe rancida]
MSTRSKAAKSPAKARGQKPADPPVHTLDHQVSHLSDDKMASIIASALAGAGGSSALPLHASTSNPATKRKASLRSEPSGGSPVAPAPLQKKTRLTSTLPEDEVIDAFIAEVSPAATGHPVRNKKKTEKALAAEEASPAHSSPTSSTPRARSRFIKLEPSSRDPQGGGDLPSGELGPAFDPLVAPDTPSPAPKRKFPREAICVSSSDESLPEVSNILPSIARTSASPVARRARRAPMPLFVDDEASDGVAAGLSDSGEKSSDLGSFIVGDNVGEYDSDAAVSDSGNHSEASLAARAISRELAEVANSVMQPAIQDPKLQGSYEGLPLLLTPARFIPFGYDHEISDGNPPCAHFSTVGASLAEADFLTLCRGVMFVSAAYFVNFARIDPALLTSKSKRICLIGKGVFCAGVMCGVVTASHLMPSNIITAPGSGINYHRVTIVPFAQELRRDMAMMTQVLGLEDPKASISSLGLSFGSRGQGRSVPQQSGGYSSPRKAPPAFLKNSVMFSTVQSPKKSSSREFFANFGNAVVHFEDAIPVYDGTHNTGKPFGFSDTDFEHIKNWPPWCGKRSEVPEGAVVAVAYSVSYYGADDKILTTNALFVIVLGLPVKTLA